MSKKRMLLPAIAVAAALLIVMAGAAFAQSTTPTPTTPDAAAAPATPKQADGLRLGGWLGGQQDWTEFDATASALKLTPSALFEQLHSGKTLSEIAEAQGVDVSAVQQAAQEARTAAQKAKIEQAVQDGTMTQEQADWLLQGLENGWSGGFGGRGGHGGMGGRGMGGPGLGGLNAAPTAPSATPATGAQS